MKEPQSQSEVARWCIVNALRLPNELIVSIASKLILHLTDEERNQVIQSSFNVNDIDMEGQAEFNKILDFIEGLPLITEDYSRSSLWERYKLAKMNKPNAEGQSEDVQCNNCGVSKTQKTEDGHWCKMCHNEM